MSRQLSKEEKKLLIKRVDKALETVRPHLAVDGGDVEIVEVTDDMIVQIKWLGTCQNCSMTAMTMKAGIQEAIMNQVPEIHSVVALNGIEVD